MQIPKQIQNLIEAFERLPGVGPKTAARLAFYLTFVPETETNRLGEAVLGLKKGIVLCSQCRNLSEGEVCEICDDQKRDQGTILVVETPLDVFSFEKSGQYRGVYHVLHGVINPLSNIGPEELYIADLMKRVDGAQEIILAMNPTMEGEATAMYITKQIRNLNKDLEVTRMGVGIPIGGDLQYADETTLSRALEGRRKFE